MFPLIVIGVALFLVFVSHQVLAGLGVLVVGIIVATVLASREDCESDSNGDGDYNDEPTITVDWQATRIQKELKELTENARANDLWKGIPFKPVVERKKVKIKVLDIYTDYDK